jgi:hypothetical protein
MDIFQTQTIDRPHQLLVSLQDIRFLHKTSESNFSMEDLCPAFIKAAMTCTQS